MNQATVFLRKRSGAIKRRRHFLLVTACLLICLLPAIIRAHPEHGMAQLAPPARPANPAPPAAISPERTDARLTVTIIDAALGQPTPVRVRITDETGKPLGPPGLSAMPRNVPAAVEARLAVPGTVVGLPKEAVAVMYGTNDSAQGYGFQVNGAFYVSGSFDLPMPAGKFFITISKGYEFIQQTEELTFKAGDYVTRRYELRRWIDMPGRGWYSADDHIHLRRSPRENPLILDWIAAEDIHVGVLLQMGDFWTTYFSQYAWGQRGVYGKGRHLLTSGQEEPRTHDLGHTISLGADQFVRFPNDYFSYDKYFDRVHALNGVSGYAHQGVSFHGYRGMALDALGGKIDFLEVMQFCVQEGPLALENYYRFLDLGCKLTALGGSDFPWCGRGLRAGEEQVGPQIGDARFYTYIGGELSFERWLTGVKGGHTFVTTGPMLDFTVNGQRPGSSIDVQPGATLRIVATGHGHRSQVPLQRIQIIGHGKVLAEATAGQTGQTADRLSVAFDFPIQHGIWLAARVDAGPSQLAHTTPVYVTMNGDGFQNRAALAAQIEITRQHLHELRQALARPAEERIDPALLRQNPPPWRYPGAIERLEERITETERKLAALRALD
jgi:hypothetical protein